MVKRVCDENPGKWVLVSRTGHSSWPWQIQQGRKVVFQPPGAYESIMRNGNGLIGEIYVRLVPDPQEEQHGNQDRRPEGTSQGVQPGADPAS